MAVLGLIVSRALMRDNIYICCSHTSQNNSQSSSMSVSLMFLACVQNARIFIPNDIVTVLVLIVFLSICFHQGFTKMVNC